MDHRIKSGGDEVRAALYIHPRPAASGLSAFGKGSEKSMTARSSHGLDVRRRKLLFRAWRRGVREMDLIVGRFADAFIDKFDQKSLDDFETLIEAPNADLYAWVVGDAAAPANYDTAVLKQLIGFHAKNFDGKAGEGT
jgi:antitoxin CptB